jgi:hypothetical protein
MTDKNDIYKSLVDYFRFDRLKDIFLQIFEILLTIAVGGMFGAWLTDYDNKLPTFIKFVAVISLILLLVFILNRLLKTIHFPIKAVEHLKASDELQFARKELSRKDTINEYIDQAIISLNSNTCPMTTEAEETICEAPLEEGIKTLLSSIVTHTHYILECNKSKFSVIVHLSYFPEKVVQADGDTLFSFDRKPKTLNLRDDYNLYGEIFKDDDIIENPNVGDPRLIFYKQGLDTFNNYKFVVDEIEHSELKIISAPIPAVCEGEAVGVLFIVCDKCITVPSDTPNILQIFGRLTSNWINNYENCIKNRRRSTTASTGLAGNAG